MADQHPDRQAALHLELGVEAGLGLLQGPGRQVGGDDLELELGEARDVLLHHHGQGIGLLTGGAAGAPHPHLAVAAGRGQLGQDVVAQMVERGAVAEEARLGRGQDLDGGADQHVVGRGPQLGHQGLDRRHALAARQGRQPALDEEGALHPEHQTGPVAGHARDELQILGPHMRPAWTNFASMMSPSKGFMMYSSAPSSRASAIRAGSFSLVQNTTTGPSPPGS